MPNTSIQRVRMELTAQSRATIAKLNRTDLMPELRREMTNATRDLVPAVKLAARALPSTRSRRSTPGGSLRNAVANSIQRKMRLSARQVMAVIVAVPHGGKENLGQALDGQILWHHPVFGRKNSDTIQDPEPFFDRTLDPLMPAVTARIQTILTKLEQKL